jgi:hypothetical protein
MTTLNKSDIKKATTAELLAFYNANSGRGEITRFADRATAEKRVRMLIDQLAGTDSPGTDAPADEKPTPKAKDVKPVKAKAAKPKKAADDRPTTEKRAESIAKSWKDPEVHAARSARNGCKVGGQVYTSVPMAFRDLKLDMKKHQRVRRQMVLNGHVTFEGHRFTLTRD